MKMNKGQIGTPLNTLKPSSKKQKKDLEERNNILKTIRNLKKEQNKSFDYNRHLKIVKLQKELNEV